MKIHQNSRQSLVMQEAFYAIGCMAKSPVTILINGESGTEKRTSY